MILCEDKQIDNKYIWLTCASYYARSFSYNWKSSVRKLLYIYKMWRFKL